MDANPSFPDLMTCLAPLHSLEEHRHLLNDPYCQNLFESAIHREVRPGDTVLDLGTGSGIHAFLACQAGARKVYAIDSDTVIQAARENCRENGFADRVTFLYGDAREMVAPEKVDVIITNLGFLNTLNTLPIVAQKWLKPGGRLVPGKVRLGFVPIEAPQYYEKMVESWNQPKMGMRFGAMRKFAVNRPHASHFAKDQYLSHLQDAPWIDLRNPLSPHFNWNFEFRATRSGICHGLMGCYTFELSRGVELSTRPPSRLVPELWYQPFIPFETPLSLTDGDRIAVELDFYYGPLMHEPVWRWKVKAGRRRLEQNSFDSFPLAKEFLTKLSVAPNSI